MHSKEWEAVTYVRIASNNCANGGNAFPSEFEKTFADQELILILNKRTFESFTGRLLLNLDFSSTKCQENV